MSSTVVTLTEAHAVTLVTENMLDSMLEIIKETGLNPDKYVKQRDVYTNGISAWLESRHISRMVLEIIRPVSNELIRRWDIDIHYSEDGGDGTFSVNTDKLKLAIYEARLEPWTAQYRVIVSTLSGAPQVPGWETTTLSPTDHLSREEIGETITAGGIKASAAVWNHVKDGS